VEVKALEAEHETALFKIISKVFEDTSDNNKSEVKENAKNYLS